MLKALAGDYDLPEASYVLFGSARVLREEERTLGLRFDFDSLTTGPAERPGRLSFHEEVHFFPDFEAADALVAAEGISRVGRHRVDRLLHAYPEQEDTELEDEKHGADVGAPGVEVGGDGDGGAGIEEASCRRPLVQHQEEGDSRQEGGRCFASGERPDSFFRDADQMVG